MSTDKTILEEIRAIFTRKPEVKVELATETLDEGAATLEAEVFEAGQPVFIVNEDERIALPVNEEGYLLDNGMTLIVLEEGIIAEMKEAGTEEEAPVAEEEEVAATEKPNASPLPKKIVESVSKESHFTKEQMDAKDLEITELKAQLEAKAEAVELEKEEEVKHIVPNPEKEPVKLHKFATGAKKNINSSVMSRIANIK